MKYHEEVEDRLDSLESWPCSFLIVALVGWFVDVLLEFESSDVFEFASGWTELVVFFFDQSRQSCYKIILKHITWDTARNILWNLPIIWYFELWMFLMEPFSKDFGLWNRTNTTIININFKSQLRNKLQLFC